LTYSAATSLPTRSSGTEKAPPSLLTNPIVMGSPVGSAALVDVVPPSSGADAGASVPSSSEQPAPTMSATTTATPAIVTGRA
jgi:hypothetical protein